MRGGLAAAAATAAAARQASGTAPLPSSGGTGPARGHLPAQGRSLAARAAADVLCARAGSKLRLLLPPGPLVGLLALPACSLPLQRPRRRAFLALSAGLACHAPQPGWAESSHLKAASSALWSALQKRVSWSLCGRSLPYTAAGASSQARRVQAHAPAGCLPTFDREGGLQPEPAQLRHVQGLVAPLPGHGGYLWAALHFGLARA